MRNVFLIVTLCVVFNVAVIYSGGSRSISEIKYAYFTTDTTGDSAQAMFFELSHQTQSAGDSVIYMDTFVVGSAGFDSVVAKFVSPVQSMRLTLGVISANPEYMFVVDSIAIGVVGCTVVFASQELGIEYDLSTGADSSLSTALDSIVDIFNKRTNLKDSCVANRDGGIIKIVSKFSQEKFTARWSMKLSPDSLDTASDITTEAEVMAGMVAAINDEADIATYLTAATSGDTGFWVTSDDPGLAFLVYIGDTAIDTTHGQLNVTSSSQTTDTMFNYPIWLLDDNFRALGINGDIVLDTTATDSSDSVIGLGTSDSASLWVRSFRDSGGVRIYRNLDSIIGDTIPLTLHLARIPAWANDTVFWDGLVISWYISDTLTDSVVTRKYPIYIDLNLTEM